jgi:hypothetical protein
VLLVVGGPITKRKADPLMKNGCGTQLQSIMVRKSGVRISKNVSKDWYAVCPSDGMDGKVFGIMAEKDQF